MNTIKTQEEWARLAALTKEENVPEGFVYVGRGDKDLGFGDVLITSGNSWNRGSGRNWGSNPNYVYACPIDVWEEKTGLKFNAGVAKKSITLEEIYAKYDTALELKDKKVKCKGHVSKGHVSTWKVEGIKILVKHGSNQKSTEFSNEVQEFLRENGYCIVLECGQYSLAYDSNYVIAASPDIKINGYNVQIIGDIFKFGCAEITRKQLQAAKTFLESSADSGNRKFEAVKIGAGEFTLDIINKLLN